MNFFVQKEKREWPQQRRVNRTLPLFVCLLELLEKVYLFVLGKVIHLFFDFQESLALNGGKVICTTLIYFKPLTAFQFFKSNESLSKGHIKSV